MPSQSEPSNPTGPDRERAPRAGGRRLLWAIAAGVGVGLLVLAGLMFFGNGSGGGLGDSAVWRDRAGTAWDALRAAPAPIYFGIFSVAIAFPLPASVFYVTAGPIYGIAPSLAWIAPALALNTLLVHQLASGVLRPRIEEWIGRRGGAIPRPRSPADQTLLIVLVRVTPGVPYFVQTWLLALAGVDRLRFLWLTVAIQMVYATGFVVLGQSAFEGELGLAAAALALIVVASVVARLVHRRLRASRESSADGAGGGLA